MRSRFRFVQLGEDILSSGSQSHQHQFFIDNLGINYGWKPVMLTALETLIRSTFVTSQCLPPSQTSTRSAGTGGASNRIRVETGKCLWVQRPRPPSPSQTTRLTRDLLQLVNSVGTYSFVVTNGGRRNRSITAGYQRIWKHIARPSASA